MRQASCLAPNRLIPYPNEKVIMNKTWGKTPIDNRLRQLRVGISSKSFLTKHDLIGDNQPYS